MNLSEPRADLSEELAATGEPIALLVEFSFRGVTASRERPS